MKDAIKVGDRVTLSGGDRFHSDVTGVVACIHNGGDLLEVVRDGDTIPFRVTVEDYSSVKVD